MWEPDTPIDWKAANAATWNYVSIRLIRTVYLTILLTGFAICINPERSFILTMLLLAVITFGGLGLLWVALRWLLVHRYG